MTRTMLEFQLVFGSAVNKKEPLSDSRYTECANTIDTIMSDVASAMNLIAEGSGYHVPSNTYDFDYSVDITTVDEILIILNAVKTALTDTQIAFESLVLGVREGPE